MHIRTGALALFSLVVASFFAAPLTAQSGGFFTRLEAVSEVNSPFIEWGVSISADELSLFVYSERGGPGNADIYLSTREDRGSRFSIPVKIEGPVNSPSFDGGPSISSDGRTLYFASDSPDPESSGDLDLYMATREEGSMRFDSVQNLGPVVNRPSRDAGPSVSADGLLLFFASERGESRDIWMVSRERTHDEDGEVVPFQNPVRLPGSVNHRSAVDGRPSISFDGRTLFFFSDRDGNTDIWFTTRVGDLWSEALKLGVPVSTAGAHEFSPTIAPSWPRDGAKLYFAGNRTNPGDADLYQVTWVVDCNGNRISDAEEIAAGASDDCNGNDVPDECEEISVLDTAPPELSCPASIVLSCDDQDGAEVTFLLPTAEDNCDADPAVRCSTEPGTVFPVGRTEVTCTATDASGNESECRFDVTVTCAGNRVPGDCSEDGTLDLSDGICLLGNLFRGQPAALPCGDGSPGDNVALLDSNGDGGIDISDGVYVLSFLFLGTSPPVLGVDCAPITACSDSPACP